MHELGIARSALELVAAHVRKAGAQQVHRVTVRVGALSGVDPEALRFALEALAAEHGAAGAEFLLELVPAVALCARCGRAFAPGRGTFFECPGCGHLSGELRQGRELDLARLEFS